MTLKPELLGSYMVKCWGMDVVLRGTTHVGGVVLDTVLPNGVRLVATALRSGDVDVAMV